MAGQNTFKLLLLTMILGIGGFFVFLRNDEEGIKQYSVARPKPTHRMMGAVIRQGGMAWFFKLVGPLEAVNAHAAEFREVIKTTEFSVDGTSQPVFKLPKGWTQERGGEMRFATLKIEHGDSPLECSVSALPVNDSDWQAYLLANINRWRDQMRLRKISTEQLSAETTELAMNSAGLSATILDVTGFLSVRATMPAGPVMGGAGKGMPPFAGGAAAPTSNEKLDFKAPDGWASGPLQVTRMGVTVTRLAAFEVRDGDRRLEITVTKLPASAVLVNVNRWRSQIGLEEMSDEQFQQARKEIEFAGSSGDYVQFFGKEQAILGVIAVRGGTAWFVKMQGDPDLAGKQRQQFEEFVRSIRLSK